MTKTKTKLKKKTASEHKLTQEVWFTLTKKHADVIRFLCDLSGMLTEPKTGYPSNWEEVPKKYQEDFLSWVASYKQQMWTDMEKRAWEIYQLEYFQFLIRSITNGQTNCHEEAENNDD